MINQTIYLKGTCVCPFPEKRKYEENPLFFDEPVSAPPLTVLPAPPSPLSSSDDNEVPRKYSLRHRSPAAASTAATEHESVSTKSRSRSAATAASAAAAAADQPLVIPSSVPFEAGVVTVLSLGEVKNAPNFFTKKNIFPVGFKSSRLYTSIYHLECVSSRVVISSEKIKYISEIREGPSSPVFVVYPEVDPSLVFEGTSASGAWKKVLLRINDLREEAGIPRTVASVSGRIGGMG